MSARRSPPPRLAVLLLVSVVPGCADELPDRGPPIEQTDEMDDEDEPRVCIELCDPVEQDCPPGEACLPDQPGFSCRRIVTMEDSGMRRKLHDPCEAGSQRCEPGLVCMQVAAPGCTGSSGCCVAICDMNRSECTDGTECFPIFEAAAMCYEHVGACVLF